MLTEDDRRRTFYNLTVPKKLVVMSGGPFMNLVLAFVLFGIMFVGFGLPAPSLKVANVTACAPTSATDDGTCAPGDAPSAAAAAGIKPGDTIVAIGSTGVTSWADFTNTLKAAGPGHHRHRRPRRSDPGASHHAHADAAPGDRGRRRHRSD